MNPWGATTENQQLTLPAAFLKASVVTFSRNISFGNMRDFAATPGTPEKSRAHFSLPIVAPKLLRIIAFWVMPAFDRALVL